MKKIFITIFTLFIMIMEFANISMVQAKETTSSDDYETLDLTIEETYKDYKLYVLLPREYIEYAINKAGLGIDYIGSETLKNDIPGIEIDKTQIQSNVFTENGVEYVQVLLQAKDRNHYQFNVIKSYGKLDVKFKFQINGEDESTIMHLDNFSKKENRYILYKI